MIPAHRLKPKQKRDTPPLPTDKAISAISTTLNKKYQKEEKERKYAPVKEVLTLLGKGVLLSAAFIVPGSTILLKTYK